MKMDWLFQRLGYFSRWKVQRLSLFGMGTFTLKHVRGLNVDIREVSYKTYVIYLSGESIAVISLLPDDKPYYCHIAHSGKALGRRSNILLNGEFISKATKGKENKFGDAITPGTVIEVVSDDPKGRSQIRVLHPLNFGSQQRKLHAEWNLRNQQRRKVNAAKARRRRGRGRRRRR